MSDKELAQSVKELGDLIKLVVGGMSPMQSTSAELAARLTAMEAKTAAPPGPGPPPVPGEAYPRGKEPAPWVEALQNRRYPNPPSPQEPTGAYGIWRNKAD